MSRIFQTIILTPLILIGLSVASFGEGKGDATKSWMTVSNEIRMTLDKVLLYYESNQPDKAKSYIIDAYFGVFEEKKMEHAIRKNISSKRAFEIESMFGNIRKAINKKAHLSDVESKIKALSNALEKEAKILDDIDIAGAK